MTEESAAPAGWRQRRTAILGFLAIVVVGLCASYLYVRYRRPHIRTDDAIIAVVPHPGGPPRAWPLRQVPGADGGLTHSVGGIGQYCFVQVMRRD